MIGRRLIISIGLLGLALPALAWGLSGGVGGGPVEMELLDKQLEDLAARQGAEFSPISLVWGAEGAIWPWPNFGARLEYLSASGAVLGREVERLSTEALGLEACFRGSLGTLGLEAGLGCYWVTVSGLATGQGTALGGHVAGTLSLLSWGTFGLKVRIGGRYLPGSSVQASGDVEVLPGSVDFSGPFIDIVVEWNPRGMR